MFVVYRPLDHETRRTHLLQLALENKRVSFLYNYDSYLHRNDADVAVTRRRLRRVYVDTSELLDVVDALARRRQHGQDDQLGNL